MTDSDKRFDSLRTTSEQHHALLLPHVDRLLTLAEMVGHVECSAIHEMYDEEYRFIVGQLIPHMDTIETTLYDRIESVLAGRHTLGPMREEHQTMRQLVAELGRYREHVEGCTWSAVEGMALRRALYRLYSLLKVHLAEEELYIEVLDRTLDDADRDRLGRSLGHAMAEDL
jgi:Hemerythrin HHE cation binding domain